MRDLVRTLAGRHEVLVASLVRSYDPDIFWRYMPRMLEGLLVTAQLVVSSVLLGGLLVF